MTDTDNLYGSLVFNDNAMKKYLPQNAYLALKATIEEGRSPEAETASQVADAMKTWALEHGATHFTHWFQPLTGATAEKHTAFISPDSDGRAITEFGGRELIKGEPDASSFPSGGLRATFEARGYTAWDPTSYAFIKDNTLCIPCAFCSYSGEALDKKTPLLKSMEALSNQAVRIMKLFGNSSVKTVSPCVGLEQEYFLIDKALFLKRPDLRLCGRTLIGAVSPKGQELDDHYFGSIRPRVSEFMKKLDNRLWKYGIPAKIEHNEVAPGQHELVAVHATANISVDQNQLMMEEMKKVADSMNLACLLHEKPFAGVNGSGKHNNWSLKTDTGINLFEPGDSPEENSRFLLFLCAVITAVDRYQGLLRLSVSSAGNDLRLGADEAPPAVISVFLGDKLENLLKSAATDAQEPGISEQKKENMAINIRVVPDFPKDSTDRNRTSPMAFTGNKFELRMPGSSFNASGPNIILNSAMAEILDEFACKLEKSKDFRSGLKQLLRETYTDHSRIIFNGNNYSRQWYEEAAKRKLVFYRSTVEASDALLEKQNIEMLGRYGILGKRELQSRHDVILENYCKTILLEARVLSELINKNVLPDSNRFLTELARTAVTLKDAGISVTKERKEEMETLSSQIEQLHGKILQLDRETENCSSVEDLKKRAGLCRDSILTLMAEIRKLSDAIEKRCPENIWTLPTYRDLMFSV